MATDRTALPTGTGSARIEDAGAPSRAEVQRRVSALYDRAETDTGTFNATRARSGGGGRRTVTSVANSGRPASDPSLEAVTRQWFDTARSRIGPTTPATLPADRLPDRPAPLPRPRSAPELPPGGGAARELEAGGRLELEAGGRRVPEPTGRTPAALPAAPAVPSQAPGALPPGPAASAPSSAPAAPQASLRSGKETIRQKLTVAREVLARAVPQPVHPLPAIESRPVEQTWDTGSWQVHRPGTDTWAGQRTGTGDGTLTATGRNAVVHAAPETGPPAPAAQSGPPAYDFPLPATRSGSPAYDFPVPTSGFAVPQPPPAAPPNAFPEPETGLLAASYGDLLAPAPGPTAPVAPPQPVQATLPAPEPAFAGVGFPLPLPGIGLPLPEFTLPTAPAAAPAPPLLDVTTHATGTGYLGKADKALAFARAQIGRPCVTGATGPESYDCSSLTQAAWRAAGVTLPRTALDQARALTRVALDDLRPGDLVFFHDDLSHTGLCTGNGMMIHAPGPGAAIREESVHALGEGALRGAVRPA
ncbi:C40 family peptidase [Streptomyces sp. NPDC048737]|uniref:C40 family peptidase n=1 Tax=unclassified Streptomyces TaxID=2593676 RepID=UPI003421A900